MHPPSDPGLAARARPVLVGALAAGIGSTLVQIALWLAFTDDFPRILYRDAALAAAIVLGPGALSASDGFHPRIMAVAGLLHFGLSLVYAWAFCRLTKGLPPAARSSAGALLGLALFVVNMYGFTALYPWFAAARDWITLAAHLAFGALCTLGCSRAEGQV